MKKKKEFTLKTVTEIKVFILYLLDHIAYPIDHSTLINIIADTTSDISLSYDAALRELSVSAHLVYDEIDGEKYYMVSDMGKMVAKELYDTIDRELLEKSIAVAGKHLSFANSGVKTSASILEREDKRFTVTLAAEDNEGELLNMRLTVKSRLEAEKIRSNFESHPERIYRGMLYSVTGLSEYFS